MEHRLDGKIAAQAMKENLREKIQNLPRKLRLVIVHHNDPASLSYLKGRLKLAEYLNVEVTQRIIKDNDTTEYLLREIKKWNIDNSIDGIMIDRPLPKHMDETKILSEISVLKDVDGYQIGNLGKLMANQKCFSSCTPAAAIALLKYYHYDFLGKQALVIGRSINVGKPLAMMLLNENATVTIAHSKTEEIEKLTKKADVIFLCVGKANFLKKNMVCHKTIVIDIGINFDENNKLCGDADKEIYSYIKAYSPVPGGVGVLTNIMLMENLLQSYQLRENNG